MTEKKDRRVERRSPTRNIPVLYKGTPYNSIRELGNFLGLTINQMKGILTDKFEGDLNHKEVSHLIEAHFTGRMCYIVFKKGFSTFQEMEDHFNIPANVLHSIYYKLKNDQTFESEIMKRLNSEPLIYEGIEYDSLADLCRKKKQDYPTFVRRLSEGTPFKEALETEIRTCKGHEVVVRNTPFRSRREMYNHFGYSRTIEGSLMSAFPNLDPLQAFEAFLDYLEEKNLPASEEFLTAIPMVYYNGNYFMQSKKFFEQIGVTSRNVNHEKQAKENIGLSPERIVLNMGIRINQHNGKLMFEKANISPNDNLVFIKNDFASYIRNRFDLE